MDPKNPGGPYRPNAYGVYNREGSMKRVMDPAVIAKGAAALALWRKKKAAAVKKGGKHLAKWLEEERIKKEQKKLSPMMAIKAFCNNCVGDIRKDITNCTAKKCPLFIYRPYQNGEEQ